MVKYVSLFLYRHVFKFVIYFNGVASVILNTFQDRPTYKLDRLKGHRERERELEAGWVGKEG